MCIRDRWYAADEEGRLYRIKELYGCTGRPNEGLRIDPVEQARRIREAEQNDPMLKGRVIQGVAWDSGWGWVCVRIRRARRSTAAPNRITSTSSSKSFITYNSSCLG